MKIYLSAIPPGVIPPEQLVNRIGKYMYKHIDGSFKYELKPLMYDFWFTMLYEIPKPTNPGHKRIDDSVFEITIHLSITTYQKKIRVNVIEETPNQRTLGHDVFKPEQVVDPEIAKQRIMERVHQRIAKAYRDYDYVY